MAAMEARYIEGEEVLSQYGNELSTIGGRHFHGRPRSDERDVSLILGELTATEAMLMVVRRAAVGALVRHTTAGRLRIAGFTVTHTPSPRNPQHVSVTVDGKWDDGAVARFDACFS